jgi:hypothetical protein
MVAVTRCTAPGTPRPGYGSTCPQARLETPSQTTDYIIIIYSGCRRRSMRWPRTRVIKAAPLRRSLGPCWSPSSLIPRTPPSTRRSLLLSLRWRSLQLHLTPARCQICTCTKQATTDGISVYTSNICTGISKSQHKSQHTNTQHTSVVKNLPRRQYHIRVPPEVHPSIGELEYNLRHLPPYLRCLHSEVMSTFATTVANQNL